VNILVKNTNIGTVTDVDGKYNLDVPDENAVLVFSFIGYVTQEVAINGRNIINVTMAEDVQSLEEVVVVGYSAKRQSELSSSVTVVDEEDLKGVTSENLGTMLQGKVPGLVVSNVSGHPQRDTEIVIRGTGSIGAGNAPLYVVDGIIGGTANPYDIASITVLKDAAATGLYGSRAANGVILITTKSGKSGKTRVSYNNSIGPSFHRRGNLAMMNSAELYENRKQAALNYYNDQVASGDPAFTGQSFDQYLESVVPSSVLNNDTDWPSLLTRRGFVNQHQLSVSGGNEKTTFYISGNYFSETGTLIGENYQNINLRGNLKHQISDRINLAWRINGGTKNYLNDPEGGQSAAVVQYYINMPWDPVYEDDGVTPYKPFESGFWYANNGTNYFYNREHYSDRTKELNLNTDLRLEANITDWMTFSTSNRWGMGGVDWKQLLDKYHPGADFESGRLSQNYSYFNSFTTSNLLNLEQSFGDHNLSGILGQEYNYITRSNTNAVGIDIPIGLSALGATGRPKSVGGIETETGFLSYFGQVDYNYQSRYFLVVSARRDASSRFGKNNRWASFGTIGGSWMINREDFLNSVSWIDMLKLKFSYGSTGNANIPDYLSLGTYNFATRNTYNGLSGARPARMENPDLTWEIAYTTNLGLEFAILNRATLFLDFYHRENRNLLQDVPLSAASGFASQQRNVGSLRNKGVDVNLSTVNLDGEIKFL
jgi:TonB-linked SusC/RagA family outer membrane protein